MASDTRDSDGFGEPDVPFEAVAPAAAVKVAPALNGHAQADPEAMVLSAVLMDGADAYSRCTGDGVSERSFHEPRNRLLFQSLRGLYDRNLPLSLETVAQELKTAGLVEAIGGYGFLSEIAAKTPTTIQFPYFITALKKAEAKREIQSIGKLAAGVDEYAGEMSDLVAHLRSRLDVIENGRRSGQLTARLYNHTKQIPKPEPIFTLDGTTICTPGNLTTLLSQAKAGKSAVVGGMMAAAMLTGTDTADTLGIKGPNYGKGALLHFDTEQSPYDWQNSIKTALKRAGKTTPPDWLMSFTLTGLPAAECRYIVHAAVREAIRRHHKIMAIIIDGTADLVIDPNDSKECFPLIAELHDLAIRHDTAIINVLHMNPGKDQEKARGHLGSQLERKSESNLMLHKNKEGITQIWGTKQRGKMILEKDAHAFRWSDEQQMHVTTAAPAASGKAKKEPPAWSQYYNLLPYADGRPVGYKHFLRMASELPTATGEPIDEVQFKKYIHEANVAGTIIQTMTGRGFSFTRTEKNPVQPDLPMDEPEGRLYEQ